MKPTIRIGTKEDLPRLRELIVELAIYEKEPHAVEVTLEELENDGFGKEPLFGFFVAEFNEKVEGIALHYFKYSTWKGKCLFLEDIVVNEQLRGQGIGELLFNEVVKVAANHQCKRMEWQVLEWNQPAINFYTKKYAAQLDPEWLNGRLTGSEIQNLVKSMPEF
jgi:GNAT superfamily N-acetyltransferase